MRTPGQTRRRGLVVVGIVVGAVAVAIGLTRGDGPVDEREGSTIVADAPNEPLERDPVPASARIDYAVTIISGGERSEGRDVWEVHRPFDSRLSVFAGDDAEESSTVETITFARQAASSNAANADTVLAVPPGPSSADTRLEDVLDRAVADGRVERRERRAVLDVECDVYRTADSFAVSDLVVATGDDFHDTCIDARGLVLEEVTVVDGEVVIRRVATSIDVDVGFTSDEFAVGDPTIPPVSGGGFVEELVPGSRAPGQFFEVDGPPDGFELLGRFAVVPPQVDNFEDAERRGQRRTLVSDVFVDGVDVVVFEQGSTLGSVDPFPSFDGVVQDSDRFDDVELSYGRSGPIVLVGLGDGRFLRVRGTTDVQTLLDLLDGVEEVEGSELELLDG